MDDWGRKLKLKLWEESWIRSITISSGVDHSQGLGL